jgi:hypothetical protein
MNSQEKPLTPEDCDLRDFAFMPLDVLRLRDSNLAASASGEEFRAAVLLWCTSWHQVPAGSLPNDDAQLSQFAGFGRVIKEWKKVKTRALHNWRLCSDGRYYHPVVAEKANEAWMAKLKQRWVTECARIKKHNDRHKTNIEKPSFEDWLSLGCPQGQILSVPRDKPPVSPKCPSGNALQGTEIGTGIGTETEVINNNTCDLTATDARNDSALLSSGPPKPDARKIPDRTHEQVRCSEIAVLLRQRGAALTHADPRVIGWASTGVTDTQLLQALDTAKAQREEQNNASPINAGYLDSILQSQKRKLASHARGHDRPLTQAEKRSQVAAYQFRNLPEYQQHGNESQIIDITPDSES